MPQMSHIEGACNVEGRTGPSPTLPCMMRGWSFHNFILHDEDWSISYSTLHDEGTVIAIELCYPKMAYYTSLEPTHRYGSTHFVSNLYVSFLV